MSADDRSRRLALLAGMMLTPAEVAVLLKCSLRTAKELTGADGPIPSVKIGTLRRIPGEDFDAYIESLKRERGVAA